MELELEPESAYLVIFWAVEKRWKRKGIVKRERERERERERGSSRQKPEINIVLRMEEEYQ
jgi:hypothetical protein